MIRKELKIMLVVVDSLLFLVHLFVTGLFEVCLRKSWRL